MDQEDIKLKSNNYWKDYVSKDEMAGKPIAQIYNNDSPYGQDDNMWPIIGKPEDNKNELIFNKKYGMDEDDC